MRLIPDMLFYSLYGIIYGPVRPEYIVYYQ